ncbi:uracil-DNA glycosylase family protein [Ectobacillus polymachus]|uniref:uracil-DNA glycosylase family protein n=1 Tax=Ectobacillus polymachus TaxID=1508806 RepID=UPI003A89433D
MNNDYEKYAQLVKQRRNCHKCDDLSNPFMVEPKYDSNEIGAWSTWKGDLDAKIVVIGQDWGDENYYLLSEGKCNPETATNRKLVELLQSIGISVEKDKLFFTNAILCLKTGGLAGKVKKSCFNNCAVHFLMPLLEIIKPEIVITLGASAYRAVKGAYKVKIMPFSEAVNQEEPHIIQSNDFQFKLFPIYHCGQLGLANRNSELQFKDWKRIEKHLLS